MISFIANVAPILLGFLMKLSAIKSQQASEAHKMMLEAMSVKSGIMGKARAQSNRESPMAALNLCYLRYGSSLPPSRSLWC